jgi:hypothetical protein
MWGRHRDGSQAAKWGTQGKTEASGYIASYGRRRGNFPELKKNEIHKFSRSGSKTTSKQDN